MEIMDKRTFSIMIIVFLLLGSNALIAQEELPAEEVEVIKDYEIKTKEGTRIKTSPTPYSIDPPNYDYDYDLKVNPIEIEYPAPYIRPVAMQPDDPIKYYNGYIRGSYGTLSNPSVDAAYNLTATDYYTIGGKVNFSKFNEKDITNKEYGQTYVDLHADYFLTQEQMLSLKLGGDFQDIHSFGFNHLADTTLSSLGMESGTLSDVFVDATYINTNLETNLSYGARLRYDRISAGLSDQNENNLLLELQGNTQLENQFLFALKVGLSYAKLNNATNGSDAIFYASPTINFSKGKAGIKLGATFANGNQGGAIFPDAKISIDLSRQAFILELGADGAYVQQGLKHLSGINPYVATINSIEDSKQYNFYAGLSGHLKKDVSYSVRAGYKLLYNLSLFQNDYLGNQRLFTTTQDDISSMYVSANLTLAPSERINVNFGLTKQILEPHAEGVQEIARGSWHLVPLLIESNFSFTIIPDRFKLSAGLYAMEGVRYITEVGASKKTDFGVDVNLGLDAKIVDRVTLFAAGKNILSNKYQRWYGYQNFGANFLGGVKVKL